MQKKRKREEQLTTKTQTLVGPTHSGYEETIGLIGHLRSRFLFGCKQKGRSIGIDLKVSTRALCLGGSSEGLGFQNGLSSMGDGSFPIIFSPREFQIPAVSPRVFGNFQKEGSLDSEWGS